MSYGMTHTPDRFQFQDAEAVENGSDGGSDGDIDDEVDAIYYDYDTCLA